MFFIVCFVCCVFESCCSCLIVGLFQLEHTRISFCCWWNVGCFFVLFVGVPSVVSIYFYTPNFAIEKHNSENAVFCLVDLCVLFCFPLIVYKWAPTTFKLQIAVSKSIAKLVHLGPRLNLN